MAINWPANVPGPGYDGYGEEEAPRVKRVNFGGGYSQRSPDGINPIRRMLSASWGNLDETEMTALLALFRTAGGAQTIWFPVQGENTSIKVVVTSWKKTKTGPTTYSVSATLEQEIDP